jgi:23S rRNA (cytidine1920-2'-O)/16S rRNA (cytidine1409-2'-O)-methyltransferase
MAGNERLDVALVARGLCDSREQARRLILAGEVRVYGHPADKASRKVQAEDTIALLEKPKYVSRGGLKLEGALDAFGLDVAGLVCADIGASTGGFTDCLLQRGAARVHCFDVGTNQLAWKVRNDPRVSAREQFNARGLTPADVGEPVDLAVMDLSFISLTKVLPAVFSILRPGGRVVCLVKPQFESDRAAVGKGGIVRDPEVRRAAVEKIRLFVLAHGNEWRGVVDSPITGTDGNHEYLAWIALPSP